MILGKLASLAKVPEAKDKATQSPHSPSILSPTQNIASDVFEAFEHTRKPTRKTSAKPLVRTVEEAEAERTAEAEEEISTTLESFRAVDRILYHRRVAERREAGEPEPGLVWRALCDVRDFRGEYPHSKRHRELSQEGES